MTRRPPLITFLTYERLGNTAVSLPSLLRTESDFELHIMDNNSKDDTWEFLQDTKDPRIKTKKRFNHNMGVAHALNMALSFRKEDQDFINYEYDFRIHNKDFVKDFQEIYSEFPELKAFSATTFPHQLQVIDKKTSEDNNRFEERNGKRIYYDTIMGFCSYFPFETMNQLMYYDEINCLLDMEIQARLEVLGHTGKYEQNPVNIGFATGYAMDIRTSHVPDGGICETCLAYHSYCEQGERKCLKHYKRIISRITNEIGFHELHRITKERLDGNMGIECNSIFSNKPMSKEDQEKSLHILDLFKKFTEEGYEHD